MRPSSPRRPLPGRVLGLYALAAMYKDGPIYGYALADRVAEKTEGAWRPGPGAVYPALRSLVARGVARAQPSEDRTLYSITAAGRRFLESVRLNMAGPGPGAPDLSLLWAEIAGSEDPGTHLLRRLRHRLDSVDAALARDPSIRAGGRPLRDAVRDELTRSLHRLGTSPSGSAHRTPNSRRSRKA